MAKHQEVWDLLKARGPCNTRIIADHFRWPIGRVYQIMETLRNKGGAEYVGPHRKGGYIALGQRPEDMRGLSVGSFLALSSKWHDHKRPVTAPTARVAASPLGQALEWTP